VLSSRLDALVTDGLMTRTGDGHPEYALSEDALGLWPALFALGQWGERRTTPGRPRRLYRHVGCGDVASVGLCTTCGRAPQPGDFEVRPGPGADLTLREDAVSVALRRPHRLLQPLPVR
jgi:hypothetical protein